MLLLRFGGDDVEFRLQLPDALLVRSLQSLESTVHDFEAHLCVTQLVVLHIDNMCTMGA